MKKVLFLALLLYFLVLFQTSFLVHFAVFGIVPNLVFIAGFIMVYFFPQMFPPKSIFKEKLRPEFFTIFLAGFFLDIFSNHSFTISFLVFLTIALFQNKILKSLNSFNLILFPLIFLVCFIVYNFSLSIFYGNVNIFLDKIFIKIGYNLLLAILGYVFTRMLLQKKAARRQAQFAFNV